MRPAPHGVWSSHRHTRACARARAPPPPPTPRAREEAAILAKECCAGYGAWGDGFTVLWRPRPLRLFYPPLPPSLRPSPKLGVADAPRRLQQRARGQGDCPRPPDVLHRAVRTPQTHPGESNWLGRWALCCPPARPPARLPCTPHAHGAAQRGAAGGRACMWRPACLYFVCVFVRAMPSVCPRRAGGGGGRRGGCLVTRGALPAEASGRGARSTDTALPCPARGNRPGPLWLRRCFVCGTHGACCAVHSTAWCARHCGCRTCAPAGIPLHGGCRGWEEHPVRGVRHLRVAGAVRRHRARYGGRHPGKRCRRRRRRRRATRGAVAPPPCTPSRHRKPAQGPTPTLPRQHHTCTGAGVRVCLCVCVCWVCLPRR